MFSFLRTALKDRNVGAVAPTSQFTIRRLTRIIPIDRPITVVEYGPGDGVFTRWLSRRLHPASTLLAIERNPEFAASLQDWVRDRPANECKVVIVEGDCAAVVDQLQQQQLPAADFIISGIPFSFFDPPLKEKIIDQTYRALAANGWFLVYQYSRHVRPWLQRRFEHVETRFSLWNIPPAFLMSARKQTDRSR